MSLEAGFARVKAAMRAVGCTGVEEGSSYGTPALKIKGKLICRMKDAETLVLHCLCDDKALLMELEPDIFFETDHYRGYPLVLVRVAAIDDAKLALELGRAWREVAPKRLLKR